MDYKNFYDNPYVEINIRPNVNLDEISNAVDEEVKKESLSRHGKKPKRIRKIYKRNIALSIIYTFLTVGIYAFFWLFEIAKETNSITKNNKCATPALVVFLSIITLGVYRVYWAYQTGKKFNEYYAEKFSVCKDYNVLFLVLMLLSYIVPLLDFICYAIMQNIVNKMLANEESLNPEGIYCKDSSIFNRPFWSTVLLIIIAQNFPDIILSFLNNAFPDAPGNPGAISSSMNSAGDIFQQAINNSAQQIIFADTPYMIAYSILSIVSAVLVLWWFKLRFKHSGYTGVLVFRNLGRACLLALPGLLFVALNAFGINIQNYKIGIVLLGFIPGFAEEITFRGMIIPNFMRIFNGSKGIWVSLFASAAIFGLIHATNVFAGADPGTTIFQVCYAFALGILFAGIFIRTGNLWPCIALHGLIDCFAMMSDEALKQGAVQTQAFTFTWDIIPIAIISILFIVYGIWLCRPKKHDEICEIWADKWGDALL